MKRYALNCKTCRFLLLTGASLLSLVLFVQPAAAQWPTTDWVVLEKDNALKRNFPAEIEHFVSEAVESVAERDTEKLRNKHERILEAASRWFESLGFDAPWLWTLDKNMRVDTGEPYLAILNSNPDETLSSVQGPQMELTSNPGFLSVNTQVWKLMVASAVHELFHAIQHANSPHWPFRKGAKRIRSPGCGATPLYHWYIEATAAAVQIQWLEGTTGHQWGHPFKGSHWPAWVRFFDQPLHRPWLPPEGQLKNYHVGAATMEETGDWSCTYGTWYFWYAVGEMLARKPAQQVSYLHFIFERDRPWSGSGLKPIDAGLRAAAAAFHSIEPYSHGLYSLYPQFVAQYLNDDDFYQHLRVVDVGTPALVEWKSQVGDGNPATRPSPSELLQPLASRAWRIRVHLPENVSTQRLVRFTLDAQPGTDREQLHLIVNKRVIGRPAKRNTPYAYSDMVEASGGGVVEYLVRVANVARQAEKTTPAAFMLRIEVEGYYANQALDVTDEGNLAARILAVRPTIVVGGPGPFSCSGYKNSQAIFSLETPHEVAAQHRRALPEAQQRGENMFGYLNMFLARASQEGLPAENRARIEKKMKRARKLLELGMDDARADDDTATRVAKARARRFTKLAATFVGKNGGKECQVTLSAKLRGRQPDPQTLHMADEDETQSFGFRIEFFSSEKLEWMYEGGPEPDYRTEEDGYWELCAMTEKQRQAEKRIGHCTVLCSSGRLHLRTVKQDVIQGTFKIDALHWPEPPDERQPGCYLPDARDTVTGRFYVSAGDEGFDGGARATLLKAFQGRMPGIPMRAPDIGSMLQGVEGLEGVAPKDLGMESIRQKMESVLQQMSKQRRAD